MSAVATSVILRRPFLLPAVCCRKRGHRPRARPRRLSLPMQCPHPIPYCRIPAPAPAVAPVVESKKMLSKEAEENLKRADDFIYVIAGLIFNGLIADKQNQIWLMIKAVLMAGNNQMVLAGVATIYYFKYDIAWIIKVGVIKFLRGKKAQLLEEPEPKQSLSLVEQPKEENKA